ncbi:DMT family transporter [Paracoccaceae bacterium]|nr:DMT family transporter [Paracoccaceae bacterium]
MVNETMAPDLWIIATLCAATFQTIRFTLQKILADGNLSPLGATYSRFIFAAPLILLLSMFFLAVTDVSLPNLEGQFLLFAVSGGLAQILATVCVILVFKSRNFAVGITLKKTEVILTAFVGLILIGEGVSTVSMSLICLGGLGVFFLSKKVSAVGRSNVNLLNKSAVYGLLSGLLFAISAVCYRSATLSVVSDLVYLRSGFTLLIVILSQSFVMTIWLALFEPGQIKLVWLERKKGFWVGATSLGGSFCWFTAFTLQNAAYVKAVGQIELIFSLLITTLFFKERILSREILGMLLIGISALGLILVV